MTNIQNSDIDNQQEDLDEIPSKTQRKKEMTALQDLGELLTTLKNADLDKLPLSEKLRFAIAEFKRLPNSHGARRRQLQFIGRLMRDFNLQEMQTAVEKIRSPQPQNPKKPQQFEEYCAGIFLEGDTAINSLLSENEHLERQTLRKFHLDYRKAAKLSDPDPDSVSQLKKRLVKYLKKNL